MRYFYFFLLFVLGNSLLYSNPSSPQVIAGQVDIVSQQHLMEIKASDRTIIQWKDFSIDKGEITRFLQNNSSSSVLNRVTGFSPSLIQGMLESNGKVILINPNGILVSKEGVIQTNGFIASTLDLLDQDFLQQNYLFQEKGEAKEIINLGTIRALEGDVTLLATHIRNEGIIEAKKGTVQTAVGYEILLQPEEGLYIQPLLHKEKDVGIENLGTIQSAHVLLGAQGSAYALAINQKGMIEATGIHYEKGKIFLVAKEGRIEEGGTLKSSGGKVEILAQDICLKKGSLIDVSSSKDGGEVLIGRVHDSSYPNPKAIEMEEDALITASSLTEGNGGKVVLFGQDSNRFQGTITAQGGSEKGNGGFVEISSKGAFLFHGTVNTTAPHGTTGTLLLDPCDITIQSIAASNPAFTPTYFPPPPSAIVLDTDVNTALFSNNVVIDSSNGAPPGPNGDIVIENGSTIDWFSANSLTINSFGSCIIQSGVTFNSFGTGALFLNVGKDLTVLSPVNIGGNITVHVNGLSTIGHNLAVQPSNLQTSQILNFTAANNVSLIGGLAGGQSSLVGTNGVTMTITNGSLSLSSSTTNGDASVTSNTALNINASSSILLTAGDGRCYLGNLPASPHPTVDINCTNLNLSTSSSTATAFIQAKDLSVICNQISMQASPGECRMFFDGLMSITASQGIFLNVSGIDSLVSLTQNPLGSSVPCILSTNGPLLMQTDNLSQHGIFITMTKSPLSIEADTLFMNCNTPSGEVSINSSFSGTPSVSFDILNDASLNYNVVGGLGAITIAAVGDAILIAGGNVQLNSFGLNPTTIASSSDLTLNVGNLSLLGNSTLIVEGAVGNLLAIAGQNIDLENTATIISTIAPQPVILVVDNDFPTPPGIGPGSFLMGSDTAIDCSGTLKIFTARPSQNTVLGTLKGHPYSDRTEVFGVYYPSVDPGVFFTVFYKEGFPPIPINPLPLPPGDFLQIQQMIGNEANTISILEDFFFPWESSFCLYYYQEKKEPLVPMLKNHLLPMMVINHSSSSMIKDKNSTPEKKKKECYRVKEKTYQKNRKVEG